MIKRQKTSHEIPVKPTGRVWTEFIDIKQVLAGKFVHGLMMISDIFFLLANSLRDMWNRKQQEKRAPEFDGRAECPPPKVISLYANLNNKPSLSIPNVIDKI